MAWSNRRVLGVLFVLGVLGMGGVTLAGTGVVLAVQVSEREAELASDDRLWRDRARDRATADRERREKLAAMKKARLEQEKAVEDAAEAEAARLAEEARLKAQEGLTVCNFTSAASIDVSVVTWDSAQSAWMGHGWFKAKNGECKKIRPTVEGGSVYLYGESGSRSWGGDALFCTTSSAFTLMEPGKSSCRAGELKGFEKYTPTNRAFTWRLVDA